MKKIIIAVVLLAFVLVGAYVALNRFVYVPPSDIDTPEQGTIQGTYMCLPLRDTSLRDSDCAAGIQSDDGTYYAVDFGFYSQGMPQLIEGDRLTATGIITPIETLSTDYWQKYPIVGIFSVTASLEVEEKVEVPPVATSSLTATSWVWQNTTLNDGSVVEGKDAFVLTFTPNLSYQSTTDCNSLSGTYVVDGEVLSLATPAMTKMFCEGSIENEYITQLVLTGSYVLEGDTLKLLLNRDYGVMEFKAQ